MAALAVNPWALPSYSSIYAGTARISDQTQASSASAIARETIAAGGTFTTLDSEALDLQGQRTVSENWTLDPTSAPETLVAIRAACWWALAGPASLRPEDLALLDAYRARLTLTGNSLASLRNAGVPEDVVGGLAEWSAKEFETPEAFLRGLQDSDKTGRFKPYLQMILRYAEDRGAGYHYDVAKDLAKIPPDWLHVGRCGDVPKDACYRARCHDIFVWVTRGGMAGLSAFTLVLHSIDRLDVNSVYYPKPATLTLTKQEGEENSPTVTKVTIYVDSQGRLVGGPGQYAYPVKQRVGNVGADQFLRSQITASQSR